MYGHTRSSSMAWDEKRVTQRLPLLIFAHQAPEHGTYPYYEMRFDPYRKRYQLMLEVGPRISRASTKMTKL